MKILVVGSGGSGCLEGIYLRAMRALGEDAELLDVDAHMAVPRSWLVLGRLANNRFTFGFRAARAGRALIRHLANTARRYDVICIFKGMQFSPEILRESRSLQRDALWVNINPDDPFNLASVASTNRDVIRSIPMFDIYCIWSRRLVDLIQAKGCPAVIYLPFAYDPDLHVLPTRPVSSGFDGVSFIGAWDKEREATLSRLTELRLRIYGEGWSRAGRRSLVAPHVVSFRNLYGQQLAEATASAEVCLNLMRPQNTGSHNMRTFEVPAMGGLLLTTRSEEQEEFFPEGKACLMFGGLEELKEKAMWTTSHPDEAARIRECGFARVRGHTYKDRAERVLAEVRSMRGHVS